MIPGRVRELSDEQLMRRLDGSEVEAALSKLYDRYSRTVFGVGLKMLGERSLAEELVQEVFLKVWRSAHTFDPSRASFSTWLFRVTRSVALDLYRKRAHRVNPIPNGDSQIVSIKDNSAGPQEVVDESWRSWRVSRALEALDAPHREVIDLAYFGGSPKGRSLCVSASLLGPSRPEPRGHSRDCAGSSRLRILGGRWCGEMRRYPKASVVHDPPT